MTRSEHQQLFLSLINLRMGYTGLAIDKISHLLDVAEAEFKTEDAVNASLEHASKGTSNGGRPV